MTINANRIPIALPAAILDLIGILAEETSASRASDVLGLSLSRYEDYIHILGNKIFLRYLRQDGSFGDVARHSLPESNRAIEANALIFSDVQRFVNLRKQASILGQAILPNEEIVRRAIRLYALDVFEHKNGSLFQYVRMTDKKMVRDAIAIFDDLPESPAGRELTKWARSLNPDTGKTFRSLLTRCVSMLTRN